MTALVGVDVGTSSTKAIAIDPDGTILGHAQSEHPVSLPRPGHAEQDPDLWWQAAEAALADLGAEDVAGIGLSGQMHGLVLLDDRPAPAAPGDPVERPANGGRVRRDRGDASASSG